MELAVTSTLKVDKGTGRVSFLKGGAFLVTCAVTLLVFLFLHLRGFAQAIDPAWYVSDKETAIEIGRAILKSKFGAQIVSDREPLLAKLDSQKIWMISGSPIKNSKNFGGGIFVTIRSSNGEITGYGALP
jgi:hypothetical protein